MSLPNVLRKCGITGVEAEVTPLVSSNSVLLPDDSNFNVGIVWRGDPKHAKDHKRSIPLRMFVKAFEHIQPSIRVISLQYKPTDDEKQTLDSNNIIDISPQISSFDDTASIISQLDLVITVDTSVAHVAGSLQIPVWTLIPYCCDWRWTRRSDNKTVWYPSMNVFRQTSINQWDDVLTKINKELKLS